MNPNTFNSEDAFIAAIAQATQKLAGVWPLRVHRTTDVQINGRICRIARKFTGNTYAALYVDVTGEKYFKGATIEKLLRAFEAEFGTIIYRHMAVEPPVVAEAYYVNN